MQDPSKLHNLLGFYFFENLGNYINKGLCKNKPLRVNT